MYGTKLYKTRKSYGENCKTRHMGWRLPNEQGVLFNPITFRYDGRIETAHRVSNLELQWPKLKTMRSTFKYSFNIAIMISSLQVSKEYDAIISSIQAISGERLIWEYVLNLVVEEYDRVNETCNMMLMKARVEETVWTGCQKIRSGWTQNTTVETGIKEVFVGCERVGTWVQEFNRKKRKRWHWTSKRNTAFKKTKPYGNTTIVVTLDPSPECVQLNATTGSRKSKTLDKIIKSASSDQVVGEL